MWAAGRSKFHMFFRLSFCQSLTYNSVLVYEGDIEAIRISLKSEQLLLYFLYKIICLKYRFYEQCAFVTQTFALITIMLFTLYNKINRGLFARSDFEVIQQPLRRNNYDVQQISVPILPYPIWMSVLVLMRLPSYLPSGPCPLMAVGNIALITHRRGNTIFSC